MLGLRLPFIGLEECLLKTTAGCGRLSAKEMPRRTQYQDRIELMQGTLDMLVLRTLQWGPQHGHGIGQAIRASSEEALQIEHGSLYPALHRLEQKGWLKSEWKASEANRRAKYYSLTPAGKKQLVREESKWNALVETIARVMKPA
jgi:PadR family transcriptional regulator, regulatory protein PadR